ncbi:DMT family transporter [Streptomyces formicae]|uniref:Permease of the drug/metabolite transporter (DMT) superfamily n=1 Tax=Streptomyces formicae TaxID=1616117 RepID=A0A291QMB0_9ACTN|nr:DMT family transporter [Streptomyces formicae]ATL32603.1 Permease of the drug/metabolite transporter (DMT) superfamily [Streptomyces formicae]
MGPGSRAAAREGRYGGFVFALLATVIWSGNLIAARGLRDSVPPTSLAFWRCVVAVAAIAPWAVRSFVAERRHVRAHARLLVLLGFLGIAAYTVMVYLAAHTTTATNMSLLAVTASVFMLLLSRILHGDRLGRYRVAGSAIALAGVAVLVTRGSLSELTPRPGDLWMLGATLIFAAYSLLVRGVPKSLSGTTVLFGTFAFALALLLPCYLTELALSGGFPVTLPVLASLGYVGAMSSGMAYFCWNRAVGRIGPARAGLIYYLLPLFTALSGLWLLDEPILAQQVASMPLIVAGVALGLRTPSTAPGPHRNHASDVGAREEGAER